MEKHSRTEHMSSGRTFLGTQHADGKPIPSKPINFTGHQSCVVVVVKEFLDANMAEVAASMW